MPSQASRKPVVVVGYDGSAAARAAVVRGIARAGATGHLIVVHSHGVPPDYIGVPFYQEMLDKSAAQADVVMEELEEAVPALFDVDYEPDVVIGDPADAICRVAEHRGADEIVIGTRGVGRMRAILGSVAHEVLHRARCPVTVIPERVVATHEAEAPRTAATA